MAGIQLIQHGGVGTLNAAGAQHPAPLDLDVSILCQLSFVGGSTNRYRWVLTKPAASASALSSTTSAGPSFMPDVDGGSYSVSLIDDDENEYILDIVTPTSGSGGGGGGGTVVTSIETFGDLRAATFGAATPQAVTTVKCRSVVGDGGGGLFAYDQDDTTSTDNDGTVLVGAGGERYKRIYSGPMDIRWFGGGRGITADDTAALTSILDVIAEDPDALGSYRVYFPRPSTGTSYYFDTTFIIYGGLGSAVSFEGEAPVGNTGQNVYLTYVGPQTDDPFITFMGGNGVRVRNLGFSGGAPNTAGAKYVIWLVNNQPENIGLTDVCFNDCVFSGCRNIAGAALVSLGPDLVGDNNQTDNITFYGCHFSSNFAGVSLHSGFRPRMGNNVKDYKFFSCIFSNNKYGADFEEVQGPCYFAGCGWGGQTGAALRIKGGAIVTMDSCYGENDNMTIDSPGISVSNGSLQMNQCEWHNRPSAVDLGGNWNAAIRWFGGHIAMNGCTIVNEDYYAITGATNATPIVVTHVGHRLVTGDRIEISTVVGNTAANGTFKITKLSADTFSLQNEETGANIAGSGAYVSGGAYRPAAKIMILSPSGYPDGNSSIDIRGSTFRGVGIYAPVTDELGNHLFDTTYAATLTAVRNRATCVDSCTLLDNLGGNSNALRDVGYVMQIAENGVRQVRRSVLNFPAGTLADNPTTGMTDVTGFGATQTVTGSDPHGVLVDLLTKLATAGVIVDGTDASLDSVTRTIAQRNPPTFFDATRWGIDEYGRTVSVSTAGDSAVYALELPNGCTLTSVTAYCVGGGNVALPAVMPRFTLREVTLDDNTTASESAQVDASGSVGAYNVAHAITKTGLSTVINNTNKRYTVEFVSESGANATSGFMIVAVVCGVTITAPDRQAS